MRTIILTIFIFLLSFTMLGQVTGKWSQGERIALQMDYWPDTQPDSVTFFADGKLFGKSYWDSNNNRYESYFTNPANGVYLVQAEMYYEWFGTRSNLSDAVHMTYTAQEDTLGRVFTTQSPFPTRVVLSQPPNSAINVSINILLIWQPATFATRYHLQVGKGSTASAFDDPLVNITIETTEHQLSGLEYNTAYRWRVRAGNDTGWGEWSGEE